MAQVILGKWVDTPGYVFNNFTSGLCFRGRIIYISLRDPNWLDIYYTDENVESFPWQTAKQWLITDEEVKDCSGYLSDIDKREYLWVVAEIQAKPIGQLEFPTNNNIADPVPTETAPR